MATEALPACKVDFKDYKTELISIMTCKELTEVSDVSHLQGLLINATEEPSLVKLRFQDSSVGILPNDFFGPYPIESLHLLSCDLTEIPYDHVNSICTESLTTLYISKNQIPAIGPRGFRNCTEIHTLDLSLNKIVTISTEAFLGLDNLRELKLQFNEIQTFDGYMGLGNLKILYLTGNGLEVVAPNALQGMDKLAALDLSYNKIRTLENGTLQPMTNKHNWDPHHVVYVEGNPLDCNCSLKWLVHWLTENSFRHNNPQCATPEEGPLMTLDFCPGQAAWSRAQVDTRKQLGLLVLSLLLPYLFYKNLI